MRADSAEFRAVDLRCHAFLSDVPLHDVWVPLDDGGPGRTISDVHSGGRTGSARQFEHSRRSGTSSSSVSPRAAKRIPQRAATYWTLYATRRTRWRIGKRSMRCTPR